jgi:hypothetical protein
MPLRRVASALLALAIASSTKEAHAERRTVALVNGNDVVERQVRIALSTWDLDVRHVDWTSLSSGMPGAANEARQVAQAQKVDLVVWISETGQSHALWVFDANAGHIVTRPLSMAPPTDAANAASLALTLKTLMRSTTAAPADERIGEKPAGTPSIGVFRAEAYGGVRKLVSTGAGVDLRVGVSGLWFPQFLGEYLGLALGFSAGPGVGVSNKDFAGRYLDLGVGPALRGRIPLGERFTIEPEAGPSLHLTSLDGATTAPTGNVPVKSTQRDAALDGSILFSFALSRDVGIGLRGGVSYLLRFQNYTVNGSTVLELAPLQLDASLVLGARLN